MAVRLEYGERVQAIKGPTKTMTHVNGVHCLIVQARSWYFRFCSSTSRALLAGDDVNESYDTNFSIVPVFRRSTCRLDGLRFKILGVGRVPIWQTPHFRFLVHPKYIDPYRRYIAEFYGSSEVEPAVERFSQLEAHLADFPERKVLLGRSEIPLSNQLLVIDGTHRAAIAAFRREEFVRVALTDR